MEKLDVLKENVLSAYKKADGKGKEILSEIFGNEIFIPRSISDRVKTFDDAVSIIGLSSDQQLLLSYKSFDKDIIATQALLKLSIICKALNEGWTPDWSNSNQYKYYPWFKFDGSVGRWSCGVYGDWVTYSGIGSRLVFKSRELAEYCGKTFETEYNQMFSM